MALRNDKHTEFIQNLPFLGALGPSVQNPMRKQVTKDPAQGEVEWFDSRIGRQFSHEGTEVGPVPGVDFSRDSALREALKVS